MKTVAILISPNTFVFSFGYSLSRSRRISNDFVTLNFIYHVRYPACLLCIVVCIYVSSFRYIDSTLLLLPKSEISSL